MDLALASTPSVPVTLNPRYSATRRPRRSSMITLATPCFLARAMVCFSAQSSSNNTGNVDVVSSATGVTQSSDIKFGTRIVPPSVHSSIMDSATCILSNNCGRRSSWSMLAQARLSAQGCTGSGLEHQVKIAPCAGSSSLEPKTRTRNWLSPTWRASRRITLV